MAQNSAAQFEQMMAEEAQRFNLTNTAGFGIVLSTKHPTLSPAAIVGLFVGATREV